MYILIKFKILRLGIVFADFISTFGTEKKIEKI